VDTTVSDVKERAETPEVKRRADAERRMVLSVDFMVMLKCLSV